MFSAALLDSRAARADPPAPAPPGEKAQTQEKPDPAESDPQPNAKAVTPTDREVERLRQLLRRANENATNARRPLRPDIDPADLQALLNDAANANNNNNGNPVEGNGEAEERLPEAASAPSAAKESPRDVAKWFADLAHSDASVREQARFSLMGMQRGDLAALKKVVADARPPQPSQAVVLHEIVSHVYLSATRYATNREHSGFLGVKFDTDQLYAVSDQPGVEIRHRIPGFCSFRMLQDGDLVLSIQAPTIEITETRPGNGGGGNAGVVRQLELESPPEEVHATDQISRVIKASGAGRTVTLEVVRQGRRLRVPITLDAFPVEVLQHVGGSEELENGRRQDADAYWDKEFAALVDETLAAGDGVDPRASVK